MDKIQIFTTISHIFLTMTLGWYLITNLQWYNYKLNRVIFKHKRYTWHILYFILPIFAYYLSGEYFWIYFYLGLIPALFLWQKKLDKKLVYTPRVKRFFLFLFLAVIFQDVLCLALQKCNIYGVFLPIFVTLGASYIFEKMQFNGFKNSASQKLNSMKDLTIVAITASYGKTSMKNFLFQIVSPDKKTYMTPRSVNTLGGLTKDINDDLPNDTEIYIAEAGARERGDIDDIAKLLNHQIAVIGNIGPQHIEYFKTLQNIRDTKMEILNSKNLKKAFIHESAMVKPDTNIELFGSNIKNLNSNLNGVSFELELDGEIHKFHAPLLGAFNATNLTACILVAKELGVKIEDIQKRMKNLKQVDHRLQKIEAGGKIIIDDSFNGNLEGMLSSYELVKSYDQGNRVLITPGVVESDKETNIKLAKKIDEIFDLVIITGKLNAHTLFTHIEHPKKILLHDKTKLEETLALETYVGDLILFSNDAPTFI